jgi:hypothetical protein
MSEKQEKQENAARNFAVFLTNIRDGEFNGEVSREMHGLLVDLAEHAKRHGKAKGKMSLTLQFAIDASGVVAVAVDTKVAPPKPERGIGIFWLTEDNNLSVQNPKQTKMPFRDVKQDAAPKDAPVQPAPVRSV